MDCEITHWYQTLEFSIENPNYNRCAPSKTISLKHKLHKIKNIYDLILNFKKTLKITIKNI